MKAAQESNPKRAAKRFAKSAAIGNESKRAERSSEELPLYGGERYERREATLYEGEQKTIGMRK